jgi:glycosyltransferase involved in cell wall biosynthesis
MRRVLLVSATAKRGGAERSLAALARRLPAAGWQPRTVLLQDGPLEDWLAGTEVCRVEPGEQAVTAIAALARDAEAVVANKWRGQLVAGPAAMAAGRPCVWWQQDFPDRSPAELLDGRAAAVVCSSDAVLAEQQAAAPSLRAVKIPLGIAVAEVVARRGAGAQVRAVLGVGDAPLIGTAGRLAPDKRQDVFLHAAASISRERPDARFVVLGGEILGTEAGYAAGLPVLAGSLGIADRVVFAGDRADAYAWIDALDVLVHPAEREPFGLVILEALALGTRVVAADAAGPSEILAGAAPGSLVAPRDPAALADAVLAGLAAPAPLPGLPFALTDERMAADFGRLLDEVAA